MFNKFLTALLQKIAEFLVHHKDFFDQSESEREKTMGHLSIPDSFKVYLKEVSDKNFIKDLTLIMLYLKDDKNTKIAKNAFFESFVLFLTKELARKIDYLDNNYYLLDRNERITVIEKIIKGESALASSLREILIDFTYQQLSESIHGIAQKVSKTPYVVIQSPREIDLELKKEIRNKFTEENSFCFPTFQINRKLIGGIRIFQNGETLDHSWISRVLRLTSLTAN